MQGSTSRGGGSQSRSAGIKQDLLSKVTNAKRVGGLPCKCEALSSNPSTERERDISKFLLPNTGFKKPSQGTHQTAVEWGGIALVEICPEIVTFLFQEDP
jgi:hypothetical protein